MKSLSEAGHNVHHVLWLSGSMSHYSARYDVRITHNAVLNIACK